VEEEILRKYSDSEVTLIEGKGGIFEVSVGGRMLFSKYDQGRFLQPMEAVERLQSLT